MRLTKQKAIDISIELWEWLAESGSKYKSEWAGWKEYGVMTFRCALCKYNDQRGGDCTRDCKFCPYFKKFGCCVNEDGDTLYSEWEKARRKEDLIKYAKLFLAQLRSLK